MKAILILLFVLVFNLLTYAQNTGLVIEGTGFVNNIAEGYQKHIKDYSSKYYVVENGNEKLFFEGLAENYSNYTVVNSFPDQYWPLSFYTTSQRKILGINYINKKEIYSIWDYRSFTTYESGQRYFDLENDAFVPCQTFHLLFSYKDDYERELEKVKKEFIYNTITKTYEGYSNLSIGRKRVRIIPVVVPNNAPERILLRGFKILLLE